MTDISTAEHQINLQVDEYEELYSHDSLPKELYQASLPSGMEDQTWYTIYTTPGGAAFLIERGYQVRPFGETNGVVVAMPRHRRRPTQDLGRHHTADVRVLPPA